MNADRPFKVVEATIEDIHNAYREKHLTAARLVESYLERIDIYDKHGPRINSVISLNPRALEDADRLDTTFRASGAVGPLHGIPVMIKDQANVFGMPTTLGSVLFKDHQPRQDCFVAAKLRNAGAILLGKATLGELGAGDTHGSLFGSTRNPYDLDRTVGGSSGGPAACVSANFAAVAIGQEGLASIRRPAAWTGIVGMRPSIGLVSRSGVYGGWPSMAGSLGPMARTVTDLTKLLDAMVGYDPADPATSLGVKQYPTSYTALLAKDGLRGVRLGVIREPIGLNSDPSSEDFAKVTEVFDRTLEELREAGAKIIEPIAIPNLKFLLGQRVFSRKERDESFRIYFEQSSNSPFASHAEVASSPLFSHLSKPKRDSWLDETGSDERYFASLKARETLMISVLKVMADNNLDAIVHKAVEHQPTLINDGINPPYVNHTGSPHLNTFLQSVPSIVVPAGMTRDGLPAGITFLGRPYADADMLRYAYAYEQATMHRVAPATTP